jgi:serine/threonine-protein kinase
MTSQMRPVFGDRDPASTEGAMPVQIGPYHLEEELGRGGMGTVYSAYDEQLDRRVALKRIREKAAAEPRVRARFQREARTAARLDHPGIVKVYDIFTAGDSDWMVMELVEGRRLDYLLESGALELERALDLAVQITSALAAAHAGGVVHRDLKAGNVLVTPAGHAKILDFGLAKRIFGSECDSSISIAGQLLGTPHSMSPEQAMGHEVDLRSDLFSLGSLLYGMLTGVCPFLGSNPLKTLKQVCTHRQPRACEINPEVPRRLSDLVDRLLEKDPAHRPQLASAVVTALRRGALPPGVEPSDADNAPTIAIDGSTVSRMLASPLPAGGEAAGTPLFPS